MIEVLVFNCVLEVGLSSWFERESFTAEWILRVGCFFDPCIQIHFRDAAEVLTGDSRIPTTINRFNFENLAQM